MTSIKPQVGSQCLAGTCTSHGLNFFTRQRSVISEMPSFFCDWLRAVARVYLLLPIHATLLFHTTLRNGHFASFSWLDISRFDSAKWWTDSVVWHTPAKRKLMEIVFFGFSTLQILVVSVLKCDHILLFYRSTSIMRIVLCCTCRLSAVCMHDECICGFFGCRLWRRSDLIYVYGWFGTIEPGGIFHIISSQWLNWSGVIQRPANWICSVPEIQDLLMWSFDNEQTNSFTWSVLLAKTILTVIPSSREDSLIVWMVTHSKRVVLNALSLETKRGS
jgi:hypothetical protein